MMRITMHNQKTLFDSHHGRKLRTQLSNILKDYKSNLSYWSELSVSAPNRPKIPIFVGWYVDGKPSNHLIMARTKAKERQLAS